MKDHLFETPASFGLSLFIFEGERHVRIHVTESGRTRQGPHQGSEAASTGRDRLIQQCILQVLEPICEARFYKQSYGVRPLRSAKHAIARAYFLTQIVHLHYVVDIDVKGFFDNINHAKLLKQLWALGIRDKSLLKVISKMLKAEIEGVGIPEKGTPQGGILSPLLAYVVLNELDWWIASQWEVHKTKYAYKLYKGSNAGMYEALRNTNLKEIHMVRYADDFKIFCRHRSHAERIFAATQKWLWERLSLEISPEKSRITNLRKGYSEFLGIKIKVRPKGKKSGRNTKKKRFVVSARLGDKAKGKILHEVRKQVKSMQNPKPNEGDIYVNNYNAYVIGVHNYYSCATECSMDFAKIAFLSRSALKNRLKTRKRRARELLPAYFEKQYGKSQRVLFADDTPLLPIGYVQHVRCF